MTDAIPAVFVAVILFMFPSEKPKIRCLRSKGGE